VNLRTQIGDAELSRFASEVFGLNSNSWKVADGQGTVDGVVPAPTGDTDKASQMIGQGMLKMNPMTMASVVATAITGRFHQPILQRGTPVYTTSRTLPPQVSADIRTMMRACVTSGTARQSLGDLPGVGAKTGTAEVGDATNGWMVAYRGNIAVAVFVQGGTTGGGSAGPIVHDFLAAVSG
jgi:cell division protein FtsI/penicillin-binding protein 2